LGEKSPAIESIAKSYSLTAFPRPFPNAGRLSTRSHSSRDDLARELAATQPANAESTTALRKLLEANDCAVRAVLFKAAA